MFDVYVNHWSFGLLKDISSIWEKLENFEFAPVQPGPKRFKKGNSIFTVTRLMNELLSWITFLSIDKDPPFDPNNHFQFPYWKLLFWKHLPWSSHISGSPDLSVPSALFHRVPYGSIPSCIYDKPYDWERACYVKKYKGSMDQQPFS